MIDLNKILLKTDLILKSESDKLSFVERNGLAEPDEIGSDFEKQLDDAVEALKTEDMSHTED